MRSFASIPASLVAAGLLSIMGLTGIQPVQAQQIFFGEDINTTNDVPPPDNPTRLPIPNAMAAFNNFKSGFSTIVTENFENLSNGSTPTSLTFGPDTASLINGGTIANQPTGTFNGTYPTSGNQFLLATAGGANAFTIDFSSPQSAIGFFATDIGDGGGQMTLSFLLTDGVTRIDRTIPSLANGNSNSGSAFFYGVIDTANAFTSLTFTYNAPTGDGFGIDDLTIARADQVTANAPEPGSLALLLPAIGALGIVVRRLRKS